MSSCKRLRLRLLGLEEKVSRNCARNETCRRFSGNCPLLDCSFVFNRAYCFFLTGEHVQHPSYHLLWKNALGKIQPLSKRSRSLFYEYI